MRTQQIPQLNIVFEDKSGNVNVLENLSVLEGEIIDATVMQKKHS